MPEFKNTEQLSLILNKNPDGITEGKILELKQSESGTRSSVDNLLKEAIKQLAEIICLNVNKEDVPLSEVEENVYRQLNGRKEKYKDVTVLVSIDNSPNFSIYSFKNNTLQKESTIEGSHLMGGQTRDPQINSAYLDKLNLENIRKNVNTSETNDELYYKTDILPEGDNTPWEELPLEVREQIIRGKR